MESPINFLTLHRDPARHQYFLKNQSQEPFYDPIAKAWIVTNPLHCREFMASGNLRPPPYADDYKRLGQQLGIDFSVLVFAFSHIPLCLHAEPHVRARRRMSEFLATRKPLIATRIPLAVAAHCEAMRDPGTIEVMHRAITPLVLDVISSIADIYGAECISASVAFDKWISLRKRRKVAEELAKLREVIVSQIGPDATEDDIGLRLALFVLGRDALVGTLGESLRRLLLANPGRRLMDISYPDFPLETGVPFMERAVVTPFKFGAIEFAAGDRIKIYLQSLAYITDPKLRTTFFGAGAHSCLGRAYSVDLWKALVAFLAKIPLRAHVAAYSMRDSDFVFTCPERLEVELTND